MKTILAATYLQLKNVSPNEVVKIAGITRRLKNWLRGKLDSEYAELVKNLRNDTDAGKILLKQMYQDLEKIQEAINDGDIAEYESNFEHLKTLIKEFIGATKEIKEDVKDFYQKEEMSQPDFQKKVEESLPKEYGISVNKEYHQSLKNFPWYQNLEPSLISINEKGALIKLFIAIEKRAVEDNLTTPDEIKKILSDNKDIVISNFKQAIVNGNLIKVIPTEPGTIKRVPYGRMNLFVTTEPFIIPGLSKKAQCVVKLMDLTIGKRPVQKISLIAPTHLNFVGDKITSSKFRKFFPFLKHAEQIPYKTIQLSDLELAQVLKEGYKKVFGKEPTAQALAGGWAQVILEAGRPIKLPNNNIGNIKAGATWIKSGQPYFSKETGEFTSNGKFYKTPALWKAFKTPIEGAEYYWKYLQKNHPQALQWMAAQDPVSATVTLGLNGYFTANIKKYSSGMSSLYEEFMSKLASKLNLESRPAQVNLNKPILKEWKDSYSKDEITSIIHPINSNIPANDSGVSQLFNQLVATGPLSQFVKNSIQKSYLPSTIVLTQVKGQSSQEMAYKIAYIMAKYLGSTVSIHHNNNLFEIQSTTKGTNMKVLGAIQDICDQIQRKNNNRSTEIISAPNVVSALPQCL